MTALASPMGALTALNILAPIDATATANATSAWVQLPADCEGDILLVCHSGILDGGSVTWTLETAEDGSATGAAAVTFNEGAFTQVTTSNDDPNIQVRTFPAKVNKGYLKLTGTIVTGGALVSAAVIYRKKYAS
jgi:hypothetical protein